MRRKYKLGFFFLAKKKLNPEMIYLTCSLIAKLHTVLTKLQSALRTEFKWMFELERRGC